LELIPLKTNGGVKLKYFKGDNISVIGSSHIKTNTVCQDYSGHFCSNEYGIIVVCDGHGGEKHFRSDEGSKIATNVAIEAINEFMKFEKNFSRKKESLLLQLEKNIILNWNNAVNQHNGNFPFTEEELNKLSDNNSKAVENDIEVAYGSTLIAAVLTNKYCFGIQIGDGDCAVLDKNGVISNHVPSDTRLQFNITTSLCDKAAVQNFRHFWLDEPQVALAVSTDGVRNSFSNETYYFDFCKTIFESYLELPAEEAKNDLKEFLQRLTTDGSGDDVSISIIYNSQAIEDVLKSIEGNATNSNDNELNKIPIELYKENKPEQCGDAAIMEDENGKSNVDDPERNNG